MIENLTNSESIKKIVEKIDDNQTFDYSYYDPAGVTKTGHGTTHVSILASNGDAVSLTSSINNL
jgi:gamma-glutamyltranspeptidase/glutathione hydrolase/leukotriene-C4 hydrolase